MLNVGSSATSTFMVKAAARGCGHLVVRHAVHGGHCDEHSVLAAFVVLPGWLG